MTTKNGDKAGIREVYKLVDDKMEKVNGRFDEVMGELSTLKSDIANMKGQATILGALAGFAVTVVGWFINK